MMSVNVYLSLTVPVNKSLSRAFARRLDTQSAEKSVSVNPALDTVGSILPSGNSRQTKWN